jgi:hypothetical protein
MYINPTLRNNSVSMEDPDHMTPDMFDILVQQFTGANETVKTGEKRNERKALFHSPALRQSYAVDRMIVTVEMTMPASTWLKKSILATIATATAIYCRVSLR